MSRASLLAAFAALIFAVAACPKPTPAPAPAKSVAEIYAELTEAGCLGDTPDGLASVAAEADSDAAPGWIRCMLGGGDALGCGAPCSPAAAKP